MEYKKIIVTVRETSRRTIEFDCELDVPNKLLQPENEELLSDFLQENLVNVKKMNFIDIVESELLDSEIINYKEGEFPFNTNQSYTIYL